MSRDEAHHRAVGCRRAARAAPLPAARPTGGTSRPRPPLLTARTDPSAGAVSLRGHLDRLGAEALGRTVTALRRLGHRPVVVRLGSATVTDDAAAFLAELARRLPGDLEVLR
ncbi:hypothetical protein [Geodermatophilus sp. SYSU D00710]